MMQTGQSGEQQHQQSPRGAPKLSLLGHYASSPATCHGFSILGALESQQQQPQQQQAHFHHQALNGAIVGAPPPPPPNAFQNMLQQGFLLTTGNQGYNLQLAAAAAPQMLQGLMEDLIKLSPPGSPPIDSRAGGGVSSAYNLVSLLEQKTDQLQALVHSLSQGSQHNGGVVQPHAAMAAARIASSISQIALAAVGVLPNGQSACLVPEMQLGAPPAAASAMFNNMLGTLPAISAVRNPLPVVDQHHQNHHPGHEDSTPHAFNLEVVQQDQQQQQQQSQQQQQHQEHQTGTTTTANNVNNNNNEAENHPVPAGSAVPMDQDGDSGAGSRDEDDDGEAEELVPGSYDLVEMNAVEILAEHTHFCDKCGKGFKRDANLRMHMRGHGEQYKSPAALARPDKLTQDPAAVRPRRYSCPYAGCKRNKKHRKFQPLKTVLCVKNHYRRSHCPKSLTCSKCKSKKFSVVADLKTHEKHCGRDKWQCSCGTTFSRKDKLLGHINLFQGHTPALPLDGVEPLASATPGTIPNSEQGTSGEETGHSDLVGGGLQAAPGSS